MMQTVRVPLGERSYDVLIGDGLLAQAGALCAQRLAAPAPQKVLVVADETVFALYGETALASFRAAGFRAEYSTFPPGEPSKTLATLERILERGAATELGNNDFLAALGGGITGDLTGFAAACHRRGVRFVQLPTTLLAAVDSSVGGKTGVNLAAGKNLAGAFWQPSLVICDPATHATLPAEEYANGLTECLKHGVLFDSALFDRMAARQPGAPLPAEDIRRSIELKRDVVVGDEKDTGNRRLLNLGHTLGHAIERVSDYAIPHGAAVALGMVLITQLAQAQGWCGAELLPRLRGALAACGLPTECPYAPQELFTALAQDKKRSGGNITIVAPLRIGQCTLRTLPLEAFKQFISNK
ncbi:MAG: 3-dehydroquinate synthase [Oscillospiraceae bacterium]|jgi:3-dehydroquinate synthase|nr:3-dehydroquinate synthase [Oscillospiraceae bacterium]